MVQTLDAWHNNNVGRILYSNSTKAKWCENDIGYLDCN